MPISLRGLARGLAKLDDALSGISIENGIVEWSANDVPHLVFGDDGRGSLPGEGAGLPAGAPPDDDDPPPCGHPGNESGAGGESGGGDDTEHPGDEPGAGGGSTGDDTDHPGGDPSPPSSGECAGE